jgi:hypothetical protein
MSATPSIPIVDPAVRSASLAAAVASLPLPAGYVSIGITPPPADTRVDGAAEPVMPSAPLAKLISEQEARDSLQQLVDEKLLWGSKGVRLLNLVSIEPCPAHVLVVESMTEARATRWMFAPYGGGPVDAGLVPAPWDVDVRPQTPWKCVHPNTSLCPSVSHVLGLKKPHGRSGSSKEFAGA